MNINRDDNADANPLHDDGTATGYERACPACGASALRAGARFCAVCGRLLDTDDYRPADSLRSSYHYQRRTLPVAVPSPNTTHASSATVNAGQHRNHNRGHSAGRVARAKVSTATLMPLEKNSNGASSTAMAFVAYSLVPYLGILFCPGALVMGGIGYIRARRTPDGGGRRDSVLGMVLGLVVLGAQIFLWWILYKVPEWSRGNF